jgi:PTS system mannose-specific IID component
VNAPAAVAPAPVVPALGRLTLVSVFFRSFFLQASWNRRGMQNLGFAYAIEPALRVLYPDRTRREDALRRHLGFFNCHPYMAAAILGGAIHHEERVAAGLEPPDGPLRYKQTLQGPLAAIGDGFFWTALRPFFGALGVVGVQLLGLPAVWAIALLYNAVHLTLRVSLFRAGYRRGDALVPLIARLSLPVAADRLRTGAAALAGVAAGLIILRGTEASGPITGVAAAVVALGAYAALVRGTRLLTAVYVAAAAGAAVALVLYHLHGSR